MYFSASLLALGSSFGPVSPVMWPKMIAWWTGWPFGGPWIDEAHALQRAALRDGRLAGEPGRMMVKRAAPGGEGLVVDPFSTDALARYLESRARGTPLP